MMKKMMAVQAMIMVLCCKEKQNKLHKCPSVQNELIKIKIYCGIDFAVPWAARCWSCFCLSTCIELDSSMIGGKGGVPTRVIVSFFPSHYESIVALFHN